MLCYVKQNKLLLKLQMMMLIFSWQHAEHNRNSNWQNVDDQTNFACVSKSKFLNGSK